MILWMLHLWDHSWHGYEQKQPRWLTADLSWGTGWLQADHLRDIYSLVSHFSWKETQDFVPLYCKIGSFIILHCECFYSFNHRIILSITKQSLSLISVITVCLTKSSSYSQKWYLVDDGAATDWAIVSQPRPLPHNPIHSRLFDDTEEKKTGNNAYIRAVFAFHKIFHRLNSKNSWKRFVNLFCRIIHPCILNSS